MLKVLPVPSRVQARGVRADGRAGELKRLAELAAESQHEPREVFDLQFDLLL